MNVLILGATSSIAAEAAQIFGARGDHLHLVGRDAAKLERVAARCAGAQVSIQQADFAQLEHNETVIQNALEALGQIDVVLIAHGVLGDQLASERTFQDAERILRVNFSSVVSLLIPLANVGSK